MLSCSNGPMDPKIFLQDAVNLHLLSLFFFFPLFSYFICMSFYIIFHFFAPLDEHDFLLKYFVLILVCWEHTTHIIIMIKLVKLPDFLLLLSFQMTSKAIKRTNADIVGASIGT